MRQEELSERNVWRTDEHEEKWGREGRKKRERCESRREKRGAKETEVKGGKRVGRRGKQTWQMLEKRKEQEMGIEGGSERE